MYIITLTIERVIIQIPKLVETARKIYIPEKHSILLFMRFVL